MADQTPDPWKDAMEKVCNPFVDVQETYESVCRARNAERQQHQQEIAQMVEALRLSEALALNVAVQCNQQTHRNAALLDTVAQHQQTIQQQAAQIETLTQALEPFAVMASCYDPPEGDDHELAWDRRPTIGQLRAARAAWAGASRPTEGEQGRLGNYYGRRLTASVDDGQVVVSIGVQTLAHAVAYADWANPFDEAADDYIRTFAIADAGQFAKDVVNAMLAEREDGSTPLSDFLDKMSQAAIEDGSLGLHEDEHRIKHGETAPCETWAEGEQGAPQ